jgi:general secretion pathway protein G
MCTEVEQRVGAASRRRRGFSLVEVMIVVVIIGLLASVVTVNVRSYLTRAKQSTARQEIAVTAQAVEAFYAAYSRYPTNDEGIAALTEPSEKLPDPPLTGQPIDPWSRPYQYNCPGAEAPYEVISYGADGREGGEGADADIRSDRLKEGL